MFKIESAPTQALFLLGLGYSEKRVTDHLTQAHPHLSIEEIDGLVQDAQTSIARATEALEEALDR